MLRIISNHANVYIGGHADLEADTVILGPSAQVFGDITHRSLSMEPGARFEGRSILSRAATGESMPETATPPDAAVD